MQREASQTHYDSNEPYPEMCPRPGNSGLDQIEPPGRNRTQSNEIEPKYRVRNEIQDAVDSASRASS